MFRTARWYTKNGHVVEYEWDEAVGEKAMAQALEMVDAAEAHPSGRLFSMLCPAQIDTCSEGLIKESYAEAQRRKIPWQIHAAQSTVEFHEITRRHGVSPVQWLEQLDVLGETSIVSHGIFLDDYPRNSWHTRRDRSGSLRINLRKTVKVPVTMQNLCFCLLFCENGVVSRNDGEIA